ncbi:MAG: low molecular weight phosphotyrosine protein phosphatase [Burkholderiaceae bacterium]|nr:low molecular weight phosphotyrosine protein phosphatase [Burkholderiaceae bacterium]
MAQAVLAARLPAVRALSAGTLALSGQPAHPRAIDVVRAARLGDLAAHRSQRIDPALVGGADLVLCMQEEHRNTILERMPFAAGRVRLLALDGGPIADPVYGEMAAFLDCLANLRHWIDEWIEPIAALTVVRPGRHR